MIVATVWGTVPSCWRSATELGSQLPRRAALARLLGLRIVQFLARGMTSPLREMAAAAQRDGARRLRPPRARHVARRGRRAGPRVQRDGRRARRRRPRCAATWSPTSRTSCARRSARCRRCSRTSPTASSRRIRARCGPRSPRPSGSAGSSRSCSTSRSSRAAGWRSSRVSFGLRGLLEQAARECALGDRPVRLKVCVEPGDLQSDRRPRAAAPGGRQPARQRGPPLAARGRVWLSAHAANAGRRRSWSPTRAPASRPTRPSASSSASTAPTPRAPPATAAPGSGSRSRAGSSTPTAARYAPRRASRGLPDGRGAARQ